MWLLNVIPMLGWEITLTANIREELQKKTFESPGEVRET